MVRVSLKGGIWKNSEDEILKAAVQKYGKQQWARVASLLNRKTAKQAKARWHEWLDPSIRKTADWSREEEEKLLHLAKLLPAQWKTIGPLVGNRTATQCQEHYEYLLDQAAAGKDGVASADLRKTDSAAAMAHPETKPARPDPIDMDEDELEMLQEARARLANTQGKKAKRKERERMLAQAKRLADLQKRRELKQAGLLSQKARTRSKRNRDIDLGVEIPFHKPAPAGLHDVSAEDQKAESVRRKRWKAVDYNQINEQQYKSRDREAAQLQKREQARLRMLQESNDKYAKAAAAAGAAQEEDVPQRPRVALQLPAPGLNEHELREYQKQVQRETALPSVRGSGVTAALMGDYTDRPLPTPLRRGNATTQPKMDLVQTATQLRRLQEGQTPLLPSGAGGLADDEEEDENLEDTKPVAVVHRMAAATPMNQRTRDELGLNPGAASSDVVSVATFATDIRSLARHERRAAKRARQELAAALQALPAPQFEYELAIPSDSGGDEAMAGDAATRKQDRADVEAAQRRAQQEQQEAALKRRSTVVQRPDLPRPPITGKTIAMDDGNSNSNNALAEVVNQEMRALLQHDAREHAIPGKKNKKRKASAPPSATAAPPLTEIPQSYLDQAKQAVAEELAASQSTGSTTDHSWLSSAPGNEKMQYLSPDAGWVPVVAEDVSSRIQSLHLEFETLVQARDDMRRKHDKWVQKAQVVHGGYEKRSEKLQSQLLEEFAGIQSGQIEALVFGRLQEQEVMGAERRLADLKGQVSKLKQMEAALQKRYGALAVEKRRLAVQRQQQQTLAATQQQPAAATLKTE